MDHEITVRLAEGRWVERREATLLSRYERSELQSVRAPGAYKGQHHIPGFFWISQLRELVWYESRLEMVVLKLLDFSVPLAAVLPQPFVLHYSVDGKQRRHVPDFLVWQRDGGRLLINVKPRKYLDRPKNRDAFDACAQLCDQLDWAYRTHSEPNPVLLANLNWLAGFRREPATFGLYADALVERAAQRRTIAEILSDLGPCALVRPTLFHLLWTRRLECDMDTVLESTSRVWQPE